MKREIARAAAGLLVVAGAALLSPACAENESSLFIAGILAPQPDCSLGTISAASATKVGPLMDLITTSCGGPEGSPFFSVYKGALLVGNQLVSRLDAEKIRTETSSVQVYAADVIIEDAAGNQITSYQVPTEGLIPPLKGGTPGYNAAEVLLIDAATADAVREQLRGSPGSTLQLVSRVKLIGRTLGGDEVESDEWTTPIEFCFGCTLSGFDNVGGCVPNEEAGCLFCPSGIEAGINCNCLGCPP